MVQGIHCYYGAIQALRGVTFKVGEGEIVALIGANGAGKTTTLKALSGLVPITLGEVIYCGEKITNQRPHAIVSAGIAHVPEGRQVFPELPVIDNLILGAYTCKDKRSAQERLEKIFVRFPRLKERQDQPAGTLSGGEQQMLAIGRALMSAPKLLLLDEPSMGLSPKFVEEVFDIIMEINREGTTVLLVEQNAHMALEIAHRAYVLQTGTVVMSGTGREVAEDEGVRKAYLGE
ncbi:MAG: ABC transporter ATP-binding protein [Actinobacteria bacterium]|nr:ABC transporter ATP-binding protein [Actinomycetota bacterium]